MRRHILPKIFSNPIFFPWPGTVYFELFDSPFVLSLSKDEWHAKDLLVEECVGTPFMLRQAQHERLFFSVPAIMDRFVCPDTREG